MLGLWICAVRDAFGRIGRWVVLGGTALVLLLSAAHAEVNVVASSKPVHALVAAVMGTAGSPSLIVGGTASPHSYAMRPSDAAKANRAQILFRISESLEPFTAKLVQALPATVRVVSLQDAPGMVMLERRETGAFEAHDHDGHGASLAAVIEDERDPHIWLDPHNASAMVDQIEAVLSEVDPANRAQFKTNADLVRSQIAALADDLQRELRPYAGRPFVVLHDAYQYLEKRYGLNAVGSIAVNPEAAPSGKRLTAIRSKIAASGAACVFAEPGMQPKIVRVAIEGTSANVGMLDPEATQLTPGPGLYGELMRNLAAGIKSCFDAK